MPSQRLFRDFRSELKPGAYQPIPGVFRPMLTLDGRPVWWAMEDLYSVRRFGRDARRMATDAAEAVLHCQDGSLTADELTLIANEEG